MIARWCCAALILLVASVPSRADEPAVTIVVRDGRFVPSEVEVPTGVKVRLVVRNENKAASEFESIELHREKIVAAGQEVSIYVGPLPPGRYEFFDDFNPQARGHLVAK